MVCSCWAAATLQVVLRDSLFGSTLLSVDGAALANSAEAKVLQEVLKLAHAFATGDRTPLSIEPILVAWKALWPALFHYKAFERGGKTLLHKPKSRVEQCAMEGFLFLLNLVDTALADSGDFEVPFTTPSFSPAPHSVCLTGSVQTTAST